jgi:meso-butanediol dehydrogenase/(S,S)-butanediol dehydrogenase/diacetyl reductase
MTDVAIVTGGGGGIGRAASHALAQDRMAVLVLDIDEASAQRVAGEIRAAGGAANGLRCDVSKEDEWARMPDAAAKLGRLQSLVGNAGIFPRLAFERTTVADFDRVMGVNLRAAFLGAAACLPVLRAHGGGSFTFMTSGSGLMRSAPLPMQRGFSLYGASKAALDRWAMGIAPELEPMGISVNLLCPGAAVLTEGYEKLELGAEAPPASIAPERVAQAIVALVKKRPPHDASGRYLATEFEQSWGAA